MNLCSMVLHARPAQLEAVQAHLAGLPGVEVHAATGNGRVVLTVEDADAHRFSATMMGMHEVPGVLNAALVYEYHETEEVTQREEVSP